MITPEHQDSPPMQRQRISKTKNESLQANYTPPDTTALSKWFEWAADNGVMPLSPKLSETVFTNSPKCSYKDGSLSVSVGTSGSIIAVDTLTGRHYQFSGDEVADHE